MVEIEGIDGEVFKQYEAIRQSGLTNMFDRLTVTRIARQMGFDELVAEIKKGNYGKILQNYTKAVEAGIIKR
jgi:vacuolar-type H+-ATPase subunit C/Vma6